MSYVDTDIGNGVRRRTINSGDPSIEEVSLYQNSGGPAGHYNLGAQVNNFIASELTNYKWRSLVRIASYILPPGDIINFVWRAAFGGSGTLTFRVDRVTDANTWVQGSLTGAASQDGSCDWFDAKHGTQPWAGSAGLSTIDIDYINDNIQFGPYAMNQAYSSTLPTSWGNYFRDRSINNGFICKALDTQTTNRFLQSSFIIDYIPPGKKLFF